MAIKGPGGRMKVIGAKIVDQEQDRNGGMIVASGFPLTNRRRQRRPENVNLRDESTMSLPIPYQKAMGIAG